jgi:Zn-dependent protease
MRSAINILAFVLLLVLVYSSALLHELGHAVAAWFFGAPVKRIGLKWKGGYIIRGRVGDWRDQVVTLAGPAVGLVVWMMLGDSVWGNVNLWCSLINLIPLWGTDGDRLVNLWAGGK